MIVATSPNNNTHAWARKQYFSFRFICSLPRHDCFCVRTLSGKADYNKNKSTHHSDPAANVCASERRRWPICVCEEGSYTFSSRTTLATHLPRAYVLCWMLWQTEAIGVQVALAFFVFCTPHDTEPMVHIIVRRLLNCCLVVGEDTTNKEKKTHHLPKAPSYKWWLALFRQPRNGDGL